VDAAGYVLGLNTAQLNRSTSESGSNQILDWAQKGFVSLPENLDLAQAPKFCSPTDNSSDLETRARVWLDVNCAMCHQPKGPGNANIDLRFATSLENTQMIGLPPAQGHLGIKNAQLIAPGQPQKSLMVHRVETLSEGRMPSIGSNQIDEQGLKLLKAWIKSMKP
jgi:mono/diheme cytochrome c family protein